MRTARSLTVSPSIHCGGCLPGPRGGACLVLRGCLLGPGGCLPGTGGFASVHAGIPPPPQWTEFLTHAPENITLPQTLGGNNNNNARPAWIRWKCEVFFDGLFREFTGCMSWILTSFNYGTHNFDKSIQLTENS